MCTNGEACPESEPLMVSQDAQNDPDLCYAIGFWNATIIPTYSSDNGGTFEFTYYGMLYVYIHAQNI